MPGFFLLNSPERCAIIYWIVEGQEEKHMEVTVKGLKVYYTVEGCGAEDVLILEGWGTNTQVYRPISAQLSQKYRVFTPDLPGFGKSEEPKENWTVGDYAAFVKEFAGKVGIQKVTLIGHSFGGRIILKLHENPSELPFETERIVLIDSAGIRPADTLRKRLRRLKYKVGRRFLEVFRKDRVEEYRLRHSSADYKAASPRIRFRRILATCFRSFRHLPFLYGAETIRQPLLPMDSAWRRKSRMRGLWCWRGDIIPFWTAPKFSAV